MPRLIRIASAIINSPDGKTLLVRKRGHNHLCGQGGKIEHGETPLGALRRELREQLNLMLPQQEAEFVGRFEAPAANEPGQTVVAECRNCRATGAPTAGRGAKAPYAGDICTSGGWTRLQPGG